MSIIFVASSWRWPLVGDAALLHYVVMLMQEGLVPYREIIDLNQPGALAVEAAAMALFGKGAQAWRIFDLALLAAGWLAMYWIARPRGRLAAMLAAVTFGLIHGRDGLIQLGQRDLVMAVFELAAYALLLAGYRAQPGNTTQTAPPLWGWLAPAEGTSLVWYLAAGASLGAACSIKPTALLLLVALPCLTAWQLHRNHTGRALPFLAAFGAGAGVPLLASLLFLLHEHALAAFSGLLTQLAPYHASLWREPAWTLLKGSVSSVLLPFFCAWLVVSWRAKRWRHFEDQALLVGLAAGLASFIIQGRGYPYHRYPSEVFLLLLGTRAFFDALAVSTRDRLAQGAALAGVLFAALWVAPRSLVDVLGYNGRASETEQALAQQVVQLWGGAAPWHGWRLYSDALPDRPDPEHRLPL